MIALDGSTVTTVHWAAGAVTASLLRALGTGHLDSICAFVDRVRDSIGTEGDVLDSQTLRERFHHEAYTWLLTEYRLRLLSRLDDPFHHDRILTTLWATNGALRPALSDALLLRTAIGASPATVAQLLGARESDVAARLRQAFRRVRAFGLEIKPPSQFGLDGRFRIALTRIEGLLSRARITQLNSPAARCLFDLQNLVRSRLPKAPRRRAS